MEPLGPSAKERDRPILGDLLRLIDPARAEDWTERLLREFGSLGGVLAARPSAQARIVGDVRAVDLFAVFRMAMLHLLRQDAFDGPVLSSAEAVVRYLTAVMGFSDVEEIRALFLNGQNHLICEEVVSRGSVAQSSVTPRQLIARALELNATALILVHNHPSGNPQPSRSDLQVTRAIDAGARLFQIALHDHLIIARSGWVSLRQQGWPS